MKVNLPDKRYYTISEVAEAFDVNASLLRFWEKEFDIIQPKKNLRGTRRYTQEDIKNIELIYFLVREEGYTIEGARRKLKVGLNKTMDRFEIINKLKSIKNELTDIRNKL